MTRPAIYSRPNKPLTIPVRKRGEVAPLAQIEAPEIITVDRATECHVTPDDVAGRMVDYLGPQGDYLTLEPSAGTGQLARALLASGHSPRELTMIERHHQLAAMTRKIGPTIHGCFLDYADEVKGRAAFPRIIMNPPFREVRKHIAAALSLLGRGGHAEPATLVALVPVTFEHPEAEHLEALPPDTFSTARVHTKIIRVRRD
ncbi:Phospholipid N-methyltransferase (plasmid) [Phaeobacter inhibens]|uniref:Phospholipid N-methyltransferase n=1 Tax=Phaeobacter inhibens TaxID=221822 RepID=A0ABM6RLL6_9RHOB|nr:MULTISPECIES: methyltransferase type 11 [Roseobacteraceae]AUQ56953.1 Phospholipid N-methyltransferase [Phaeobacter inhibens]AUQ68929.1 Phospholipid N-methyltransferase [Phaeobacter inhibens]AUQ80970.1 Phospholipid N-methyltransferase [Phaeobacter inhibens]AUQ97358.1 Phospholipid N-methyltransferase [Phaeobacter inhibens]AUR06212.1 Phospholipid N-methyltransferase [Phaeobacter inhibens]